MTTPTLTDFLLARIEEDERTARPFAEELPGARVILEAEFYDGPRKAVSPSATTRDYAQRVLADCKAKRAIVDLHTVAHYCADDTLQDVVAPPYFGIAENVRTCPTLLALAQPYADHEDFRDEWRA